LNGSLPRARAAENRALNPAVIIIISTRNLQGLARPLQMNPVGNRVGGYDRNARRDIPKSRPHIRVMNLDLTDEEAAALTQELHEIVENDRYPSSSIVADERGR
jgi:hypothetical protein